SCHRNPGIWLFLCLPAQVAWGRGPRPPCSCKADPSLTRGATVMTATVRRPACLVHAALAVAVQMCVTGQIAEARITKIEITSRESPALEGRTFGDVGAYEKLRGKAYGEVDPADPRNALITDIQLAPRSANG